MIIFRYLLSVSVCLSAGSLLGETATPLVGVDALRPRVSSSGPASFPRSTSRARNDRIVEASPKPLYRTFATSKPSVSDTTVAVAVDEDSAPALEQSEPTPEHRPLASEALADLPPSAPQPAADDEPSFNEKSRRKLGSPSRPPGTTKKRDNPLARLATWSPSSDTLTMTGGALAVSIGLLLITSWLVRKSLPRSARVLPGDVAESLGRVPLAGKQAAQLLRIGNKLVLVSVTPDGAKTLTEIDEPEEVQRLLNACEEHNGRGSKAAFDQVFRQISDEPANGFLGSDAFDPRTLAAAYANTPGGQGRG